MAEYEFQNEYPTPQTMFLPIDDLAFRLFSSLSQLVFPLNPPQDVMGAAAAGYGSRIDAPIPTLMPFQFPHLSLLSTSHPYYACFPQPYAYHWPQIMNASLETPASVRQLPYLHHLPPVLGLGRHGTGVFHPQVPSNNTRRSRKTRGQRRNRKSQKTEAKVLSKQEGNQEQSPLQTS